MTQFTDYIKQMPPNMGGEVQFYYRRGNRFYFRSKDKKEKLSMLVSPQLLEEAKKAFVFGKVYKCLLD